MCSVFKAFSQCSLADLAHAISVDAYSTSKDVVDSSATERIVKSLRNSELTEAVLRRHPLVLDFHRRHLVCTSADSCRDAWCSHPNRPTEFLFQSASFCRYNMLHDLFDTAGVDVGDADRRRVYLVCLECAKQPFFSLEYTDLFLGRTMHILFNQYNQIEAPMTLIDTAARLHLSLDHPAGHGGCSFSIRRHSVARASLKLWPAQRIRVMFGCTATACHRLAVAPASLNPHSKKSSHFKTRLLVRLPQQSSGAAAVFAPMWRCDHAISRNFVLFKRTAANSRHSEVFWVRCCAAPLNLSRLLTHSINPSLLPPLVF